MENASKALLIAGSILIAVALIAMGVKTISSTQGTTDSVETNMNTTEIATFNSKFTAYAGSNKSVAQIKALANVIIANNAANKQHKVALNVSGNVLYDPNSITEAVANLSGNNNVSVKYNDYGYVEYMTIGTTGITDSGIIELPDSGYTGSNG